MPKKVMDTTGVRKAEDITASPKRAGGATTKGVTPDEKGTSRSQGAAKKPKNSSPKTQDIRTALSKLSKLKKKEPQQKLTEEKQNAKEEEKLGDLEDTSSEEDKDADEDSKHNENDSGEDASEEEEVDFSGMNAKRSSKRAKKKAASDARKKVLEQVNKAKELNTTAKKKTKGKSTQKKKSVQVRAHKEVILPPH